MAVYIDSNDIAEQDISGTIKKDIYNLSSSLKGQYKLQQFNMDTDLIPWIFVGCDKLFVEFDGSEYEINFNEFNDIESKGLLEDFNDICLWFLNVFNHGYLEGEVEFSCEYNNIDNTITITSSEEITFMWNHELSSCSSVFGKTENETGTSFVLSAKYINTSPDTIACNISESSSNYITTSSTSPTLILSTLLSFTGQEIIFSKETSQLSIYFYRLNIPQVSLPLTNKWQMILEP